MSTTVDAVTAAQPNVSSSGPTNLVSTGSVPAAQARTRSIPEQLLKRYCELALRDATLERQPTGEYFMEIPAFNGVWAQEATVPEAVKVLAEVLFEWVLLKIADGDKDLPVVDGIDLNAL